MFISAETASVIIQLQLASPAITHMAAAQPQPKRRFAYRDAGVGLQLRGHTCGPDRIAHVRSEMGFDVKVECFSLQIQFGKRGSTTKNKHPAWSHGVSQLRLILPDPTAIGIGLRHASRAPPSHDGGAAHSSVTRG
jgi:hypothetical protein